MQCGPAWVSDAAEPLVAPSPPRRDQMSSWGVDQLAEYLCLEDLRGPAEALRMSGVAGSDLLAWDTAAELQADLRLSPFAARKVLAARDRYLEG